MTMRDPAKPIGKITAGGYGVSRAAGAIHYCLHFHGPQSVFVCDRGYIYVIPQGTPREAEWINTHHAWLIGTYVLRANRNSIYTSDLRAQIAGDLRARAREIGAAAA